MNDEERRVKIALDFNNMRKMLSDIEQNMASVEPVKQAIAYFPLQLIIDFWHKKLVNKDNHYLFPNQNTPNA